MEHYEMLPRLIKILQRTTPLFKSGKDSPVMEAEFGYPVKKLAMGCGYVTAIDERNNVFSWGDNYAGQLGHGDDIHREQPTLIKSLADYTVEQMSLGFQH